jgi:hypothetical protein
MTRTVGMMCITIGLIFVAFVSGAWSAGLPDISQQIKALQPDTDYKVTDIAAKKLTVSDPTGVESTFQGVNTKGFKVGDVLKGSALREKLLGQASSFGKGSLPKSIPGLK